MITVVRPLSFYVAVPFLRRGWSPNEVTGLSAVPAFAALACFFWGSALAVAAGAALFFLYLLLDLTDGNIARFRDQASYLGKFLDGSKDKAVLEIGRAHV